MYERYAALFGLRNHGGDEAVAAIIESLNAKSALLRHEVAYVLEQLQNKAASDALSRVLQDVNEHPMSCEVALSMLDFERSGKSFEYLFMQAPKLQEACWCTCVCTLSVFCNV
ncbi:putative deoxyhypusine monooxygenase [Helianthus debilis subsp. tardiflorus]